MNHCTASLPSSVALIRMRKKARKKCKQNVLALQLKLRPLMIAAIVLSAQGMYTNPNLRYDLFVLMFHVLPYAFLPLGQVPLHAEIHTDPEPNCSTRWKTDCHQIW